MKRLNLGCGENYKEGWINVDFNKEIRADVYADLTERLPFEDNSMDYVLMDNVLEHIKPDKLIPLMEELHRICKPNGIIEIYVPHCSGMYAFSHLTHYSFFGIGKFNQFRPEASFNGERYSKARFKLLQERLLFFHHNLQSIKFLSKLPINWIFNFNHTWKQLMERFQFFGFDEIYYELKVVKWK